MTGPVVVIVQARLGSTRLPGKALMPIAGVPMVAHVLSRAQALGLPVVLAIPEGRPDRPLRTVGERMDVAVYEGPEEDVLGRFLVVAAAYPEAQTFVRLTADCPLLDTGVVSQVLAYALSRQDRQYVYTGPEMDGVDVEVGTRAAFELADATVTGRVRSHVLFALRGAPGAEHYRFPGIGPLRWSVDDAEGLAFVRAVMDRCDHCRRGVPHHTNAHGSLGGADRVPVWDLHAVEDASGVGLAECLAAELRLARRA